MANVGFALPVPPLQKQPISQSNTNSERETNHNEPNDSDKRLADYTFWLTIFTGVLAAFGGLQIRLLFKADKTAREAIEIAGTQNALFGEQAKILVQQKEIQRLQFFAEHRPRLVLKDVFFSSPNDFGELTFELANIGGSEAKITGGFVALNFVSDPRQFKDMMEGDLGSAAGAVLKAGELRQFRMETPSKISFHMRVPDAMRIKNAGDLDLPEGPLYFFGAILYVDGRGAEFGIERLSAFRREWRYGAEDFARTENPDHEYAD